ncbi:unnamed protein product [Linum tenue]|uniref:Uncharacterized protein n=1 Tax=Linum tenue TaxID=586396 RepID=A0AAV0QMB9_9ROSI|nr:unnamed protein product [Linum tenue]
MAVSSELLLRT